MEKKTETKTREFFAPEFIGAGTGEAWISQSHFETADEARAFGEMVEKDLTSKFSRVLRFEEATKPTLDADGWIPHKPGDPMPVDGDIRVYYSMRGDKASFDERARDLRWNDTNSDGDITAYKLA